MRYNPIYCNELKHNGSVPLGAVECSCGHSELGQIWDKSKSHTEPVLLEAQLLVYAVAGSVVLTPSTLRRSRGCIYARFSSRFQHSIADQVRECRKWCDANGIEVRDDHVFSDEARSGRKRRRVGLQQMMDALARNEVDVVVTFATNRLHRKIHMALWFVEEQIVQKRRRCVFVSQNIDTAKTEFWKQLLHIFAMLDEWQIQASVKNIQAAHMGLLDRGLVHGTISFGFHGVPIPGELTRRGKPRSRWEVDPVTAPWVQRIYEWYVNERLGFAAITKRLIQQNAPLPRKTNRWSSTAVRYLLLNRRNIGDVSYGLKESIWQGEADYAKQCLREKPLQECYRADLRIITDELFFRAQELIAMKIGHGGRPAHRPKEQQSPEFLKEILWCPQHQHRLTVSGAGGRLLTCPLCKAENATEVHLYSAINRAYAHKVICQALVGKIKEDATVIGRAISVAQRHIAAAEQPDTSELQRLEKRKAELSNRVQFILANPGETETDQRENAQQLAMLRADRAGVERQLAQYRSLATRAPKLPTEAELRALLDHMSELLMRAANGVDADDAADVMQLVLALTSGRIELTQCGERKPKLGWLEGRFHCALLNHVLERSGISPNEQGEEVTVSFEMPLESDDLAESALKLVDSGMLRIKVARQLGISKSRLTTLLQRAYKANCREFIDGRHVRGAIQVMSRGPLLHERLAPTVGEMATKGMPLQQIAHTLGRNRDVIAKAYVFWRQTQSLPPLDGRARRKMLRLQESPDAMTLQVPIL